MAPEVHGFETVRRGYDRAQVDARLAESRAAGGHT